MTNEEPNEELATSPLTRLTQAIQEFVNEIDDEPVLLRGSVVVWEVMSYDEDGDVLHELAYAAGEGTSLSSTAGLLQLGLAKVNNDTLD